MEIIFGLVSNIIPLAIIGLIIYAIVQWRRRRDGLEVVDTGIGTVRRLYFYVVSFVALMMAVNGLVQIGQYVLEALFGDDVLSPSRTRLAVGLSLAIVGLPIWGFHWRLIQQYVGELPVERRSLVRKLYIYGVLAVAVGLVIVSSVGLLQWAFGSRSFSGYHWAAVIIWPMVWAFNWRLESVEGQPTSETLAIRRLYIYLASLVTLVMVAAGLGRVVHIILLEAYESLVTLPLLIPTGSGLWREPMRSALAVFLVGSVAWGTHWLYFARRDYGALLRQIYIYIFAMVGGVVTVLVSLGLILYGVLVWLMGVQDHDSAAAHFRFLPGALASLSIGAGLLAYHWMVARQEAQVSPFETRAVQRLYAYILAALGLGALVVAIGTLLTTAIGILVDSAREVLAGPDFWRNTIALVTTLGVLGAPLWGYHWARVQRQVAAGDPDERTSLVRRIFIFAALGAGALALLGSVSFLVFVFLRDALEGELSLTVLREAKFAIGIIVASGVFLPYYWLVHRQDRRAEPILTAPAIERRPTKEVTVLVNQGDDAFVRELEAALGYGVSFLLLADPDAGLPELSEAERQELAQRIGDAAGQNVLVIPDGKTVRVLSYH